MAWSRDDLRKEARVALDPIVLRLSTSVNTTIAIVRANVTSVQGNLSSHESEDINNAHSGTLSDSKHGNRGGGSLHPLANAADAGFLQNATGTDGHVLTVSGNTWIKAVPPGSAGGFANPMTSVGDLIRGGSLGNATRLPIGLSNQFLGISGGIPSWMFIPSGFINPMTSAGDIIYGGALGNPTRLPIGNIGEVLTVSGGNPVWAAASGSSGGGGGSSNGYTAPPTSGWSWVNQGTASIVSTATKQTLVIPTTASSFNVKIRTRTAPSTPYTITAFIKRFDFEASVSHAFGIGFRQSSDGKLHTLIAQNNGNTMYALSSKFIDPTSFSANYVVQTMTIDTGIWMQISDNGTNRITRLSPDGITWTQLSSVGRTDFLTADEIFFYGNSDGTAGVENIVVLESWAVS